MAATATAPPSFAPLAPPPPPLPPPRPPPTGRDDLPPGRGGLSLGGRRGGGPRLRHPHRRRRAGCARPRRHRDAAGPLTAHSGTLPAGPPTRKGVRTPA